MRGVLRKLRQARRRPWTDISSLIPCSEIRHAVDGGAHKGGVARTLLKTFPNAAVYAFEPLEECMPSLRELAGAEPRLTPIQRALGRETGSLEFQVGARPETSSLLPRPRQGKAYYPPDAVMTASRSVQVVRLADWCEDNRIKSIDFIKLDVQGAELAALEGAESLLKRSVQAVFCELQFMRLYEGACLYHEVAAYLKDCGFRLYNFYDMVHASDGQLVYCDGLFLKD